MTATSTTVLFLDGVGKVQYHRHNNTIGASSEPARRTTMQPLSQRYTEERTLDVNGVHRPCLDNWWVGNESLSCSSLYRSKLDNHAVCVDIIHHPPTVSPYAWHWHLQFVIDEDDILSRKDENILGMVQFPLGLMSISRMILLRRLHLFIFFTTACPSDAHSSSNGVG